MAHNRTRPSFLDEIVIDHGPEQLLTSIFLRGDFEARSRGLRLTFENLATLAEVNRNNKESWLPLFPSFDPNFWQGDEHNAFAIVGRNQMGDVVATQALRVFHWNDTNFARETEALRLLYLRPESHQLDGERWTVTARHARTISGRVALSGGIWFRPDYRGRYLTGLMVRLGRAYAIARYDIDTLTAVMSESVFGKGLWKQVGHRHFDEWVEMHKSRVGTMKLKFMWLSASEVVQDLSDYLLALNEEQSSKGDHAVVHSHAQQ